MEASVNMAAIAQPPMALRSICLFMNGFSLGVGDPGKGMGPDIGHTAIFNLSISGMTTLASHITLENRYSSRSF
jgi:hypothetical protein